MRARTVCLITILSAAVVLPDAAQAQFSPQGLLNGISRPFRSMFGHFGHFPRHHRSEANIDRRSEPNRDRRGEANMARSMGDAGRPNAAADARLGRVGPPAWPTAFEDMLGYAFWPDDYVQRLRGHGFDVIADTITGRFVTPRAPAQASTTGSAVQDDVNAGVACRDNTGTPSDWPSARLGQTVQLSNAQHDVAETIQTAVIQSSKTIKADCAAANTMAAPDRLRTLVQTLWTVRDAGTALRTSLKEFDDSLTDAQKMSFASRMPEEAPKPDAKNQTAATNRQYQACAAPNVEEAERLIKQIELRVRPTTEQAVSLENLHKVSSDMAKMLMASCAQPIPKEPLARLDAANDQLTAMNYAATTVQIAFNGFYSRLDNTQKARFDNLSR
jgi:hypothetical protein